MSSPALSFTSCSCSHGPQITPPPRRLGLGSLTQDRHQFSRASPATAAHAATDLEVCAKIFALVVADVERDVSTVQRAVELLSQVQSANRTCMRRSENAGLLGLSG
eukprot:17448-Pleurochrysis_carterae.AAC.2